MIFVAILAAMMSTSTVASPSSTRTKANFNREWKFLLGDHPGAEQRAYDDAGWDAVGLPHSFSMPYFLSNRFYVGYGWYRKDFKAPVSRLNKRVFLEFEGAFQDAEVFVNGQLVGRHRGGYTGFSFDVTDAVQVGDNVVAVRLNNNWHPQLAPRAGEHVFSGGIYRDVHLVVTEPLHVTWCGTFVTTPKVSKSTAIVNVKTEVRNAAAAAKWCTLHTEILDPNDRVVARMSTTHLVEGDQTITFDQTSKAIASPKLWHPDHPFLYRAVSTVHDQDQAVDRYETTFGIRWFEWTADRGFFLNGEHHYFKGVNVHQDRAGWGDAATNAAFERDVKMVKEAGFDFIRGSHYPHDPAFSDACDRLGMLFWSENAFWGTGGFSSKPGWSSSAYPPHAHDQPGFEASVKQQLAEMIRIHRNHPSIIAWSMCNEPFFSEPSTLPRLREFLKELVAYSHELDPTRPAAIGGCQRGEIDKLGDVAGYNGDGARLFMNPGIPNVVSEYGSVIADRPGRYDPGWGELQQQRFPWRSGQALWCGFDHGSLGGRFGWMGMVDYFRLPKRQWYWYCNEYRKIPPPEWPTQGTPAALQLAADKTVLAAPDGTDDAHLTVTVVDAQGKPLSNCPPVTLTIESGPGEFPTGPSITFAPDSDIAIRDGKAAIEFRSYYAGKTLIRAMSPGLSDATLSIITHGEPVFVAGQTPTVKPRPYTRYTADSTETIVLGRENPIRASSEAPGRAARHGNDGNPATFWQAADMRPGAWWQVNLERIVVIKQVKLVFPTQDAWRYTIEASEDGKTWHTIVDRSANDAGIKTMVEVASDPVRGLFVRVTFADPPDGKPAALAELEAIGVIQP